jgi:hypothetical protein
MGLRRKNEQGNLEARLRNERPSPSDDLVSRLEQQVADTPIARRGRLRVGVAIGFATALAALVAVLGGSSLFGSQAALGTTEFALPAKAGPAVDALKSKGALLASRPAQIKRTDGTTTRTIAPKAVTRAKVAAKPGTATVRSSGAATVRYAAAVQYDPNIYIPVCYPIDLGEGDFLYITILVPIQNLGSFVPPGTTGFCPSES